MGAAGAEPAVMPDRAGIGPDLENRTPPAGMDDVEYVVIGADTGISSPYPWVVMTGVPSLRFQVLYHADEIGRAGAITQFALRTAQDMQYGTFNDVMLKMAHTPLTALGPRFEDNYHFNEPETVFTAASREAGTSTAGQWCNIELDIPFEYDGSMNLLIEVTWQSATGVSVQVRCPRWSEERWLAAPDREASSGTTRPLRHDARIGFALPGGIEAGPAPLPPTRFRLGPNPLTGGIAALELAGVRGSRLRAAVYDAVGHRVLDMDLTPGPAGSNIPLDLRALGTGIYLVRLTGDDWSATGKLVIK